MYGRACWCSWLVLCVNWSVKGFTVDDELAELRRGPKEYAALHGMRLDVIEVETSDGWLLEVHRVRSMSIFNETLSPPVVLSHGLGCSSMEFMSNPRNESFAFILADRGYDVWITNHRANKFSNRIRRQGKIVKPNVEDYIHASWQYMAERDMPAVLDKALETTKQAKMYLAGQSMGGTVLFAFLAKNHNYDDKILLLSTMVPSLLIGHDTVLPLKALAAVASTVVKWAPRPVFNVLMSARLLATSSDEVNEMIEYIQSRVCQLMPQACFILISLLFQRNPIHAFFKRDPHLRASRTPIYLTKYPAGATASSGLLYAQQMYKTHFSKMDYDAFPQSSVTNEKEYNQTKPPAYDFTAVRVPLQTFFVVNDFFTGPETAKKVIQRLDLSPSEYFMIKDPLLTHHDANWGWDARCYFFDHIVDLFDRLELQRAGLERVNSNTSVANSSKIDEKRAEYRNVTIPKFINTLPFQRTCSNGKE